MKTMRLFLILFAMFLIPVASFSQPPQKGSKCEKIGKDGKHCMWKDLELNDEQQEKIKALHEKFEPQKKERFEEVRVIRKKIKDELLKANPSQGDLDKYAQELGNVHAKMSQDWTNHMLSFKGILTQEQFTKLVSEDKPHHKAIKKKGGKQMHHGNKIEKDHDDSDDHLDDDDD